MAAERFSLSDQYVASRSETPFAEHEASFDNILRKIEAFRPVTSDTKIFEIGAGLGWFEIICAKRSLSCAAIEPNPVVRRAALRLAEAHGVQVDIEQNDIETAELGAEGYDVVIATSVFEHVQRYALGLAKVYQALRPGGVFYFYSTNKFSFRSGEYPGIPLYGWLPYRARRRIRVSRQGQDIVDSSGIDFNQFTYWGLHKLFRGLGFSRVLDRVDYVDPDGGAAGTIGRRAALHALKSVPPLRAAYRAFASGNSFVCVK